ncbi:hypothetical protein [Paenibacillus hamazuiensis]|uniref:hypothetical protein n=1 Tax=Paenibacillus hamazuiensis TaxID=2936508 RepID=UPI00200EACF5|nr:hypothetical protein [Paenibacillus hamazuiensis]
MNKEIGSAENGSGENLEVRLEKLRAVLERLLSETGGADRELGECLDGLADFSGMADELKNLRAENERLRHEVRRLRLAGTARSAETMSSKLKDALRE